MWKCPPKFWQSESPRHPAALRLQDSVLVKERVQTHAPVCGMDRGATVSGVWWRLLICYQRKPLPWVSFSEELPVPLIMEVCFSSAPALRVCSIPRNNLLASFFVSAEESTPLQQREAARQPLGGAQGDRAFETADLGAPTMERACLA